jgi:carboxymethylenebutenolidase
MSLPVRERLASISTGDGNMQAFVAQPDAGGPFPAVLIVQHIGGVSESMKGVARRAAEEGYFCAVPALYHRLGEIVVDPLSTDDAVASIRSIAVRSLRPARVMADLRAALDWLGTEPAAASGRRGLIGYGGGAGFALLAAASFPTEIGAVASILGAGFIKRDQEQSPHRVLGDVKAELYFSFAAEDEIIPARDVEALAAVLAASGVRHRVVVHAGVGHGYCFPDRAAYAPGAADRDGSELRAVFGRTLN